jgi:hypothetical protein
MSHHKTCMGSLNHNKLDYRSFRIYKNDKYIFLGIKINLNIPDNKGEVLVDS